MGTVFRILLPASEVVRPAEPVLQEPKAEGLDGGGSILVVDDEADRPSHRETYVGAPRIYGPAGGRRRTRIGDLQGRGGSDSSVSSWI